MVHKQSKKQREKQSIDASFGASKTKNTIPLESSTINHGTTIQQQEALASGETFQSGEKKLTKIEVKYVVSYQTTKRAPETVGLNSLKSREQNYSPEPASLR